MDDDTDDDLTPEDLREELKRRDRRLTETQAELTESRALLDEMREHVEDVDRYRESWIEAFRLEMGDNGKWQVDPEQSALREEHGALWDKYIALLRDWNKFARKFNATVSPRNMGRPLAGSEAQAADVLKRRKAGESLRAIAKATSLSFRTVRTIIERPAGKDRTSRKRMEVRRLELDRQRAAAYRVRKRNMDAMPKQMSELQEAAAKLIKAAKGLGR